MIVLLVRALPKPLLSARAIGMREIAYGVLTAALLSV
jgi:hypothetical protein